MTDITDNIVQLHRTRPRPPATREEILASYLHGIIILEPRLDSPDENTRLAARLMLATFLTKARQLGVCRPNPPLGAA